MAAVRIKCVRPSRCEDFRDAVRAGITSTNLPPHIPSKSTARTLCFWKIRAGIVTSTKERGKKKKIKAGFVSFGTLLLECNGNPAHLVRAGAHLPAAAPQDFLNRPHCCLAPLKQGNARRFRVLKDNQSWLLSRRLHAQSAAAGGSCISFERTVRPNTDRTSF